MRIKKPNRENINNIINMSKRAGNEDICIVSADALRRNIEYLIFWAANNAIDECASIAKTVGEERRIREIEWGETDSMDEAFKHAAEIIEDRISDLKDET